MLKIENVTVHGFEESIRGMRNPMNSWERSDSKFSKVNSEINGVLTIGTPEIGPNDHELMMKLARGGPAHAKYRRMITVYFDITAPLYWWKEYDTYKVGTVANSCSTMHKIHDTQISEDIFSFDHVNLCDVGKAYLAELEKLRQKYIASGDKKYWYALIQLLPSSYNQRRTLMLSYEVLANIYPLRRDHKLEEWRNFCRWIEGLPYSEIILADGKSESVAEKTHITYSDRIILSAYTGVQMCDFDDVHKFIEETLGRPVLTHELADELVLKEIQKKIKPDFLKIIS